VLIFSRQISFVCTDSTQNTSTNNQSVFEQLITENMNSQSGASIVQDQNTAVVSEANDSYYGKFYRFSNLHSLNSF